MTTEPVKADLQGSILVLTLNRPERRNAMSQALVEALLAQLRRTPEDPAVRAVVLCGAGRGFCAGSDLAELAPMDQAARHAFEAASGLLARSISQHALPILAAVHGFAIGGGLTLAAACDLVVTAPETKWSLPEVPIGLFPAWGLQCVTDRTGVAGARRLAWGIDTIDGSAACETGLADEAADAPFEAALALATRLAALPASQSAAVKSYFAEHRAGVPADDVARGLFDAACDTPEARACFSRFTR